MSTTKLMLIWYGLRWFSYNQVSQIMSNMKSNQTYGCRYAHLISSQADPISAANKKAQKTFNSTTFNDGSRYLVRMLWDECKILLQTFFTPHLSFTSQVITRWISVVISKKNLFSPLALITQKSDRSEDGTFRRVDFKPAQSPQAPAHFEQFVQVKPSVSS